MSQLSTYLTSKKLKPQTVLNHSARVETGSLEDAELLGKRAEHRAKNQNANYGEATIGKPKSGRGLSKLTLDALIAGKAATKRARAKLVRALASIAGDKADLVELRALVTPAPSTPGNPENKGKGKKAE